MAEGIGSATQIPGNGLSGCGGDLCSMTDHARRIRGRGSDYWNLWFRTHDSLPDDFRHVSNEIVKYSPCARVEDVAFGLIRSGGFSLDSLFVIQPVSAVESALHVLRCLRRMRSG